MNCTKIAVSRHCNSGDSVSVEVVFICVWSFVTLQTKLFTEPRFSLFTTSNCSVSLTLTAWSLQRSQRCVIVRSSDTNCCYTSQQHQAGIEHESCSLLMLLFNWTLSDVLQTVPHHATSHSSSWSSISSTISSDSLWLASHYQQTYCLVLTMIFLSTTLICSVC